MLELQNAHKVYETGPLKTVVLQGTALHINDGEMIAITGPSGSGKSTLLNILGCLDDLTTGDYLVDARPMRGLDVRARARLRNETFGFVFQFFGLVSEYSAVENVMLPLLYRKMRTAEARRHATDLLEQVGLGPLRDKRPEQLSGGQQQRVALARALVGRPRYILADEPTGSLDSATGNEVMRLLEQRNREGYSVVVVTHSPEVSGRCSRILYMRDGNVSEIS